MRPPNKIAKSDMLEGESKSFSKLVTLLLNLITEEKSGSEGNEVVASEVVGVRVGVVYCGRGLQNECGGGIVVVKQDVISETVVA
ncbi:hypothetical protein Tco_0427312 [Tanacetum coccineum]